MATANDQPREVSIQINGIWIRRCRLMTSQYDGYDLLARKRFTRGALIAYKSKKWLSSEEIRTIYGSGKVYDITVVWDAAKDCPACGNATITPKAEVKHKADNFTPSAFQQAIIETVTKTVNHVEIKAYAGSGKTATLVLLVKTLVALHLLPRNVLFMAFNKTIEEELTARLAGTGCPAVTTHAFGFRALKAIYGKDLTLDNRRNGEMFLQLLCDKSGFDYSDYSFGKARKLDSYKLRNAVLELASHCKNAAVLPKLDGDKWVFNGDSHARAMELLQHYEVEIPVDRNTLKPLCTPDELVTYALETVCKCIPVPGQSLSTVAFDDMLYLPVALAITLERYALVLTDESQDFNMTQILLLERLVKDGARVIFVGDPNQALYHFRGADSEAFAKIGAMLEKSRPLTRHKLPRSYRCCQRGIEYAKQWVPDFEGERQELGTVATMRFGQAMERANNNSHDIALPDGIKGAMRELKDCTFAFLCRINVPLVVTAYQLIAQGKRVCILGRGQIGQPLQRIIQDQCCIAWKSTQDGGSDDDYTITDNTNFTLRITDKRNDKGEVVEQGLLSRLADYERSQRAKLEGEKLEKKLEKLAQDIECLEIICTRVKSDSVIDCLKEIERLFAEEPSPGVITLSTIHRSKGLQWNVTFMLRPDLLPFPMAKTPEEIETERCCCYVGYTRHMDRSYLIEDWPFGNNNRDLDFERPEEFLGYPDVEEQRTTDPAKAIAAEGIMPWAVPAETVMTVEKPPVENEKPKFVDDGEPF